MLDVAGDIPVVEDAAHAFPSPIAAFDGRFAGTIGRAGAFSFYATKTITTGEGGMLATDDAALADRARTMRLHGIGRDAWKRYTAAGCWYYEIEAAGFKDNLTDLAAAIGLAQLERAAELRAARVAIAAALSRRPRGAGGATGASLLPAGGDDPSTRGTCSCPARSRRRGRATPRTPTCPASPALPDGPSTARVAASPRDRRARRGRDRDERALHPAPSPSRSTSGWAIGRGSSPTRRRPTPARSACRSGPGMTDDQVDRVIDAVTRAVDPT